MGPSDGCMFCSDQTVRCAACTSACVADGDAIDIASAFTVTMSSVNADGSGGFEFTSSVIDMDALAACLETSDAARVSLPAVFSDAAHDPVAMVAPNGPTSGPFANIQIDAVGPIPDIHTTADGIQWIDTAHPNVVNTHHQIPYSPPNVVNEFVEHLINLYNHPPFGVIHEGGYVSADSGHSSMSPLENVGSSDEWTDDDQFVYDSWDDSDSNSSTDSIPIQTRAENDSDFRQSDLDDDYNGYIFI